MTYLGFSRGVHLWVLVNCAGMLGLLVSAGFYLIGRGTIDCLVHVNCL